MSIESRPSATENSELPHVNYEGYQRLINTVLCKAEGRPIGTLRWKQEDRGKVARNAKYESIQDRIGKLFEEEEKRNLLVAALSSALNQLEPRKKDFLELRFGLTEPGSEGEMAKDMTKKIFNRDTGENGVSKSTVNILGTLALGDLRNPEHAMLYAEFLPDFTDL